MCLGVYGGVGFRHKDETYSNTKNDVTVGQNHKYSKLIVNAKISKLKSRWSLSESTNE